MFNHNYFSRQNKLLLLLLVLNLTIADNLPFVEVRAHVDFKILKDLIRVDSPLRGCRSELRRFEVPHNLFVYRILADVQIRVVLGIEEEHVVVVHNWLTLLSVLVTRVNEEAYSLG